MTHGGGEERDGRTEEVLATATSRPRRSLAVCAGGARSARPGCSWSTGAGHRPSGRRARRRRRAGRRRAGADAGRLGGGSALALLLLSRAQPLGRRRLGVCSAAFVVLGQVGGRPRAARAGWPASRRTHHVPQVPVRVAPTGAELAADRCSQRRSCSPPGGATARATSASVRPMWQPEPGWQRLPGAGPATVGVWSATHHGHEVVVKRLRRPEPQDAPGVLVPGDVNYWRRAADVALSGVVAGAPGLREAPVVRVDEDDEGITLVHERVETEDPPGLWLARLPGPLRRRRPGRARVAGARPAAQPAAPRRAARRLADPGPHPDGRHRRPPVGASRGVAGPLRRPPAGGPARRPVRGQHPGPATGDGAVAIDWAHLGRGPVGADLGYLSLATREDVEPLLDAYVAALPAGLATPRRWSPGRG